MILIHNIDHCARQGSRYVDCRVNALFGKAAGENNMPVDNRASGVDDWIVVVAAIGKDRVDCSD